MRGKERMGMLLEKFKEMVPFCKVVGTIDCAFMNLGCRPGNDGRKFQENIRNGYLVH